MVLNREGHKDNARATFPWHDTVRYLRIKGNAILVKVQNPTHSVPLAREGTRLGTRFTLKPEAPTVKVGDPEDVVRLFGVIPQVGMDPVSRSRNSARVVNLASGAEPWPLVREPLAGASEGSKLKRCKMPEASTLPSKDCAKDSAFASPGTAAWLLPRVTLVTRPCDGRTHAQHQSTLGSSTHADPLGRSQQHWDISQGCDQSRCYCRCHPLAHRQSGPSA